MVKKKSSLKRIKDKKSLNQFKFIIIDLLIKAAIILTLSVIVLTLDIEINYIFLIVTIGICNALMGYIIGSEKKKNGLFLALIYTLPGNLSLLVISLILNGFKFDYFAFLTLTTMMITSAVGGVVSVNKKKKIKV